MVRSTLLLWPSYPSVSQKRLWASAAEDVQAEHGTAAVSEEDREGEEKGGRHSRAWLVRERRGGGAGGGGVGSI